MLPGMFRRAPRTAARKFVRLEVEALEARTVPTAVTVTNTSGDAATPGSLPFEVAQSNANGGYTIQFSNLFTTPQTINLAAPLIVTQPLDIEGPGANLLTIAPATGNNLAFYIPYASGGTAATTISGVTLANTTGSTAAAIVDVNSNLTLLRSVITGFNNTNSNGYQGGGIDILGTTALTIGYSTISGNSTTGRGGAVAVSGGSGTENIYESTITGNTATNSDAGGGIYLGGHNAATIRNSTIAGNSAPHSNFGGGIGEFFFSGTLTLDSSIVAQNTDQSNHAPDINQDGGSTLAANYSLIGSTTGITAITGANNPTGVSPGFTTFTPSDNGGPTPTLPLPAGSPALGTGTANGFTYDQRGTGFPRTVNGATDIGAFQTQPAPPAPPANNPAPASPPSSGPAQTPWVSTAYGPLGPVVEAVSSAGVLTQYDAAGAHVLSTGVAQASVAFGPAGEVLLITYQNGNLFQSDAFGAHFLGSNVRAADAAFGPQGEVYAVVYRNGLLAQYDASGGQVLSGDVASADLAFGPQGEILNVVYQNGLLAQVEGVGGAPLSGGVASADLNVSTTATFLDIVYQNGLLFQYGPVGGQLMGSGVQSASATFSPMGTAVLDVIFGNGTLAQFDATGIHKLASGV